MTYNKALELAIHHANEANRYGQNHTFAGQAAAAATSLAYLKLAKEIREIQGPIT